MHEQNIKNAFKEIDYINKYSHYSDLVLCPDLYQWRNTGRQLYLLLVVSY